VIGGTKTGGSCPSTVCACASCHRNRILPRLPQISSIVPFLAAVGFSSPGDAGFVDSPLEGAGFEPPVPLGEATVRDRFASL
jgi:hypothetical protein